MNVGTLINDLTVFVLAILLGFEVISRVPLPSFSPPRMSSAATG